MSEEPKWVDMSTPQYYHFQVVRGERHTATITKQRVRGGEWCGWIPGQAHKYGPFDNRKQAEKWALKQ